MTDDISLHISKQIEEYIIIYFGSAEEAVRQAPFYELEYGPVEIIEENAAYYSRQELRIRKRTSQE